MMLKQEIHKLFNRKLILIMIGLCLLNVAQLYYLETKTVSYAANGEYKQLWNKVRKITESSGSQIAFRTINKELKEKRKFFDYYLGYMDGFLQKDNYSKAYIQQANRRIKDDKNINYESLHNDIELYERVATELGSVVGYKEYLKSIDMNVKKLTTISIFQSKDSFANRNIQKTPKAYNKMKNINLTTDASKGIELFSSSIVTDMIAVFLLLYCAVCIWVREREEGIKGLLFTCFHGRKKLAAVKLMTMAVVCLLVEILLYGGNLLLSARLYGLGDLSRYLPSVYAFSQTAWKISVLQYLLVFLLVKYIAYVWISMLIIITADLCTSLIYTFGCVLGIGAVSTLTYTTISGSSLLSFFKYLLPCGLLRTENLFTTYRNLNLFGLPVELTVCTYIVLLFGVIAFSCILLSLYIRRKKEDKVHKVLWLKTIAQRLTRNSGRSVNLWYHELYKVFITQKVLFLFMILIMIQIFVYQPKEENIGSVDDYFFKQYMMKLSGPLTKEKEHYIKEEQDKFKELNAASSKLISEGKIGIALEDKLRPYQAFQRVLKQSSYLKKNRGAYFVYDVPYNEFTAGYNNQNDAKLALEYILLVIICTAGIFGMDYQLKAEKLCSITIRGRYKEVFLKLGICMMINLMLLVAVYLPFLLQNWKAYGMESSTLSYPVNSLMNLSRLGSGMSIGAYLLLINLCRFLYAIVISFAVCMIALKTRNVISTMMVSILVFALPTGFLLASEKFVPLYYLFSPILGNLVWTYSTVKGVVLVIIIGSASVLMLYRMIFAHKFMDNSHF